MMESPTPSRVLAGMNTDALGPEDTLQTFVDDSLALEVAGVEMRTHFVAFGPIPRARGYASAVIMVKMKVIAGPGGTRELYEVSSSPYIDYDVHAMAQAAARASKFVGDARRVDLSQFYYSDYLALAREVAGEQAASCPVEPGWYWRWPKNPQVVEVVRVAGGEALRYSDPRESRGSYDVGPDELWGPRISTWDGARGAPCEYRAGSGEREVVSVVGVDFDGQPHYAMRMRDIHRLAEQREREDEQAAFVREIDEQADFDRIHGPEEIG